MFNGDDFQACNKTNEVLTENLSIETGTSALRMEEVGRVIQKLGYNHDGLVDI